MSRNRAEKALLNAIWGEEREDMGMRNMRHLIGSRIRGGTQSFDAPSLCRSCHRGTTISGVKESEELVHCGAMEKFVPFKVRECSNYSDKRQASKWEMEKIAWVLVTDRKRGHFGFISAKEFKKNNPNEEIAPQE